MALVHANVIGSSGPDIIVLHGFLGMGDNWKSHGRQWHYLGYRFHLTSAIMAEVFGLRNLITR